MTEPTDASDAGGPDVAILLDHFATGGVTRVACELANGLQQRGFRVEMLVLMDQGPVRSLLSDGVSVRSVGSASDLGPARRMKTAVPAIAAYLQARCPRLFHAPGNQTIRPAARAVRLARYRGAFVVKVTNPLVRERKGFLGAHLRRLSYRRALRGARLVLVLSRQAVADVAAVDRRLVSRTRVVHNPYVTEAMVRASADRNPADPPIILAVGRLSEQKNHALLLKAAARLGDRPWRVRICGTGPEEDRLRALARELAISDRLELPGFVTDPVPEYLAATVVALSSRWEGLPAAALEAMACGCPVVSTASSPGLVELLREVGAREPVALDDVDGLAEALRAGLDGALPSVPASASAAYTIDASCDEHAAIFGAILASRAGGSDPMADSRP